VGLENFCTKLPKGTFLRQIWSNKSFGVCGSDVVLTLESDEKKSTSESQLENRVVYNTTSLPRRRDNIGKICWLCTVDVYHVTYYILTTVVPFNSRQSFQITWFNALARPTPRVRTKRPKPMEFLYNVLIYRANLYNILFYRSWLPHLSTQPQDRLLSIHVNVYIHITSENVTTSNRLLNNFKTHR